MTIQANQLFNRNNPLSSKKGIIAVVLSAIVGAAGISSLDIVDRFTGFDSIYTEEKKTLAPLIIKQFNEYKTSWDDVKNYRQRMISSENILVSDQVIFFELINIRNNAYQTLTNNLRQGEMYFGKDYQKLTKQFLIWNLDEAYAQSTSEKEQAKVDKKWEKINQKYIKIFKSGL